MAAPIEQQQAEPAYGAGVQAEETAAIGEQVAAQNAAPPAAPPAPQEGQPQPQQQQPAQGDERLVVNNLLRLPPGALFKNRTMPDGSPAQPLRSPVQRAAVMSQMWDVLAQSPSTPDSIKALARIYRLEEG